MSTARTIRRFTDEPVGEATLTRCLERATYELHDRAGEFISVLFAQQRFPAASELLLGGSMYPTTGCLPGTSWSVGRRASTDLSGVGRWPGPPTSTTGMRLASSA